MTEAWFGYASPGTIAMPNGSTLNIDRKDGAYPTPHWSGKFVILVDDGDTAQRPDKEGRVKFRCPSRDPPESFGMIIEPFDVRSVLHTGMDSRSFAAAILVFALTACTSSTTPQGSSATPSSTVAAASPSAPVASGVAGGVAVEKIPVWPSATVHAVLWRPASPADRKPVAVLLMHEYADFTQHSACADLSSRGFQVLCANGRYLNAQANVIWDNLALDLKAGVEYLRRQPDIKKVFLLGHSGGGAMMPYYENVAENGVAACQDPRRISPCSDQLANTPKADGLILLDPIPGLAFADLTSTDPSVTSEDQFGRIDASKVDPGLDMFSAKNGFDPKKPTYSPDFIKRFYAAQGARHNRLISLAQSRLEAIKSGNGWFPDDEPFVVSHANSRLWVIDLDLFSHTQQPHTILTASGEKQDIARSVRTPGTSVVGDISKANLPYSFARKATVRSFLSTFAIRTGPDFQVMPDSVVGVDWQSTNTSLLANLGGVKAPLLMASMTGHYWLVSTEMGFNASPSTDKTLVYLEGASHGFTTCKACETTPGQFGDTNKTLMDYLAKWLNAHI